ncbi:hypothetical protein DM01DRAFT_325349 [Hesseltinella vesiculosa]|uniref:Uncharacterized protein n=1 Tax=Hesseltinella vesiculosa TaxID=101127 RepID=A0A1X2G7Q1_9FUNG|nr:hypothetical protein DM01DRAFT_325349 [Hesseltinella vesiculosa]
MQLHIIAYRYLFLGLVGVLCVDAFCFENAFESFDLVIRQLTNNGPQEVTFHKVIHPGGKECCNFQNLDCNQSNAGNDVLTSFLRFVADPQWQRTTETAVAKIAVPSGGFCRHSGDPDNPTLEIYNAFGQQIHPEVIPMAE